MTSVSSPPAIAASGLRKSYGDKVVLDGIDLNVAEGTVFSLLGPNGAGKTTAVQILSTYLAADGGEVRVAGHDLARDPDAVRAAIGVTGQFSAVDRFLNRRGEPHPDGGSAPSGQASGPAASRRAPRTVRSGRGGRKDARRPTPAACGAGSTSR
jgi:hypothetical protein